MRAADLLTILTNPPQSKEYQGIFLMTKNHKRPVTTIEITQKNEVILHFNQQKNVLTMKEILVGLMMNREKNIYYQVDNEIMSLYGVKETGTELII
ncbi:hypothetical protein [Enterococcus thailandicus]|uniref:hypothetical protein n=1 Tax=Enterococcus thailandicus TaxID=417368 RepID=UPI000BAFAAA5|nr:hypothetical protein [Enterococcus thailandicus]ASZ07226.1 hypothetical protein CK496_04660 [Enterococcus thailandicus]